MWQQNTGTQCINPGENGDRSVCFSDKKNSESAQG